MACEAFVLSETKGALQKKPCQDHENELGYLISLGPLAKGPPGES